MKQIFAVKENQQNIKDLSSHLDPLNKFTIIERTGGHERVVLHIDDSVANPEGVAKGVVEILNRDRKLILPIYKR